MKRFLVLVSLVVGMPLAASAIEGFTPIADFKDDSLKTQLAESIFIIRNGITMEGCSATKIGDDLVLTAFHCMRACLLKNAWFDQAPQDAVVGGEPVQIYRRSTNANNRVTCEVFMQANMLMEQAEVIAGPHCTALVGEEKTQVMNLPGCDRSNDQVVLRYINSQTLGQYRCSKLAVRPPAVGDAAFDLGYPINTKRGIKDSDGRSLFSSEGEIMKSDVCYRSGANGVPEAVKLVNPPSADVLQTSVDIVPRSSGSPLFNKRGEILGVASGTVGDVQSAKNYCAGASFFSNITKLKLPLDVALCK